MKNLGVTSPAFRLFAVCFGLFFGGFAVTTWVRGTHHDDLLSVAMVIAMVAAGAWIVSIGIVGVPTASGQYVGGGPLLPRVKLMPGESIAAMSGAIYHADRIPVGELGAFFNDHRGQLFLTDRRVIFSPFRFRLLDRAFSISYADVQALALSNRTNWATMGYTTSFDLLTADGIAHIFWVQSLEIFETLKQLRSTGDAPDAP